MLPECRVHGHKGYRMTASGTSGSARAYRAAWVPYAADRTPEDAAELAAPWLESECSQQGTRGLLLTSDQSVVAHVPALARLGKRHQKTTTRVWHATGLRGVPVLVHWPTYKMMAQAISATRGSSLVVTEAPDFPLSGWARETRAVDLTRVNAILEAPNPQLTPLIEYLYSCGNNAYSAGFGRDRAQQVLLEIREAGLFDADEIIGAILARGMSDIGIQGLQKLIASLDRGED